MPQGPQVEPKRRARASRWSSKGAQAGPKSCQEAAQEHLESTTGNLLNLRSRLHGSVVLRGRGRSGRGAWMPFCAPSWRPSACPECPGPSILLDLMTLFTLFPKVPFALSKCSWTAFWQLLGPSWAPFGLNLGPLGHLLSSTWGLLAAFGAHLGASWAPLGLH